MLHNMFITNVHNMFITNLILRTATRRFLWVRRAHAQLCGRARPFICSLFLCAGARRVAENRCDRREKLQSSFERRQHCRAVFFAVFFDFPEENSRFFSVLTRQCVTDKLQGSATISDENLLQHRPSTGTRLRLSQR